MQRLCTVYGTSISALMCGLKHTLYVCCCSIEGMVQTCHYTIVSRDGHPVQTVHIGAPPVPATVQRERLCANRPGFETPGSTIFKTRMTHELLALTLSLCVLLSKSTSFGNVLTWHAFSRTTRSGAQIAAQQAIQPRSVTDTQSFVCCTLQWWAQR